VQRLTLQPTVTIQLAAVVAAIRHADRDILGFAREAGQLLLTAPPEQREALALDAGMTGKRTRFRLRPDRRALGASAARCIHPASAQDPEH
jgi:hypothetical protein